MTLLERALAMLGKSKKKAKKKFVEADGLAQRAAKSMSTRTKVIDDQLAAALGKKRKKKTKIAVPPTR